MEQQITAEQFFEKKKVSEEDFYNCSYTKSTIENWMEEYATVRQAEVKPISLSGYSEEQMKEYGIKCYQNGCKEHLLPHIIGLPPLPTPLGNMPEMDIDNLEKEFEQMIKAPRKDAEIPLSVTMVFNFLRTKLGNKQDNWISVKDKGFPELGKRVLCRNNFNAMHVCYRGYKGDEVIWLLAYDGADMSNMAFIEWKTIN